MRPEGWHSLSAEVALHATSRIGWKGLSKSDFTTEGPYLITGMHFRGDGRIDWPSCFRIPQWRYDESPEVMVRTDDILLTKDGTIGKVAHVRELPGPAALNSHLYLLRPSATGPVPRFLFYVLQSDSFRQFVGLNASGSTIVGLPWKVFRNFEIPVPPPGEQRKIAAILSSVDDAIDATQAAIDQLQVLKQGMMAELLTRGLPGRHVRFKQTEIGEVPEEWATTTYGNLAANVPRAIQSGPFGSALRHEEFGSEGVFVVGIDNVQDGFFSRGSEHRITPAKFETLRKFGLRPLDLLIVITGASTGRACVFPAGWEKAILTKHVYRLTVDPELADSYFLLGCLRYLPGVVRRLRGVAQGLSRPGLNKDILLPVIFPLPSLSEQKLIAAAGSSMDDRIDAEGASLTSLINLRRAIMSVLLTGELRVTPDEAAA